jgi:hypothetical protein
MADNTQSQAVVQETGIRLGTARLRNEYRQVTGPGNWKVLATGQANRYVNENILEGSRKRVASGESNNLYSHSILINLKAVEGRKAQSFIQALESAGEFIDVAYLKNLTMVYAVHLNEGQDKPTDKIPMRNQEVEIVCDWAVDTETGELVPDVNGDSILNITDIKLPGAFKATSFANIISKVEEEPEEVTFDDEEVIDAEVVEVVDEQ